MANVRSVNDWKTGRGVGRERTWGSWGPLLVFNFKSFIKSFTWRICGSFTVSIRSSWEQIHCSQRRIIVCRSHEEIEKHSARDRKTFCGR